MPTVTFSGTLSLPALELAGSFGALSAAPGPASSRQSEINFDLEFRGDYWAEINDVIRGQISWKAEGLKFVDRTGDGTDQGGQSNRLWFKKDLFVPGNQPILLDLYSYLTINGGMGFGKDYLGLPLEMDQITLFLIYNHSDSAGGIAISPASVAPWDNLFTTTITIPPGNFVLFQTSSMDAPAVEQGSAQYLQLLGDEADCTIDVFVAGRDQ